MLAIRAHIIFIDLQALILHAVTLGLERSAKQFFVHLMLVSVDAEFGEADRPGLHGGCQGVRLVPTDPHHRPIHNVQGLLRSRVRVRALAVGGCRVLCAGVTATTASLLLPVLGERCSLLDQSIVTARGGS